MKIAFPFRVGAWLVEPSLNRIVADGCEVQLEPKVMALLMCLARRAGQVVSREELLALVWGDLNVVDGVVSRAMYQLRKALGEKDGPYIETVRQVGYRLIAPVTAAAPAPKPQSKRAGIAGEPFRLRDLVLVVCAAVLVGGVGVDLMPWGLTSPAVQIAEIARPVQREAAPPLVEQRRQEFAGVVEERRNALRQAVRERRAALRQDMRDRAGARAATPAPRHERRAEPVILAANAPVAPPAPEAPPPPPAPAAPPPPQAA